MYTTPWELIVNFQVVAYDSGGNEIANEEDFLTITYDPAYNVPYIDHAVREYPGAHSLQVNIVHICGQPEGITVLPDDFILDATVEVDRHFIMDAETGPTIVNQTFAETGMPNSNPAINLFWSFLEGAEEYELQYLYVSDKLVGGVSQNAIKDYKNATRIITPFQKFELIPAYQSGSIYYRVRGLAHHGEDFAYRHQGAWSLEGRLDLKTSNGDYLPYESDKNWTRQVTHAEFGKHSESLIFFDGNGVPRQSVSKDNSSRLSLIQENLLDYEGRPAVSISPVPMIPNTLDADHLDMGSDLKYYSNFNLAHGSTTPFNKEHFDLDDNRKNPLGLEHDEAEKSGVFYSEKNPLVNYGHHRFLPNAVDDVAGAFIYSRTIYDEQGRVKEQSGLGPNYEIGSGHTTRYFYGNPSQKKLDRLFGTEIGYAEHYRRKLTEDPNGQLSVSYETLAGEVVATALVGNPPVYGDNQEALVAALDTDTGIIGETLEDLSSHNEYNDTESAWELQYTELASAPGTYTFYYNSDLSDAALDLVCTAATWQQACEYYLDISILGPEGEVIDFEGDFNISVLNNAGQLETTISENELPVRLVYGNNYTYVFDAYLPEIGNYTISKKLRLANLEQARIDVTDFVSELGNGCISTYPIAADCLGPNYQEGLYSPDALDCATMLEIFKEDMSPGGQYFDNIKNGVSNTATINDWLLGIFDESIDLGDAHPNILKPDNNGGFNQVKTISFGRVRIIIEEELGIPAPSVPTVADGWDLVRAYWYLPKIQEYFLEPHPSEDRWLLYRFHPEYPHYEWCEKERADVPDYSFDYEEMNFATNSSIIESQWIPNLEGTCPTSGMYAIMTADPYFDLNDPVHISQRLVHSVDDGGLIGWTGIDLMKTLICTYPEDEEGEVPERSMWEVAEASAAEIHQTANPTNEQVWPIFRRYYNSAKYRVKNLQKKNPCGNPFYTPFLHDTSEEETPPDFIADFQREHDFYLWGASAYCIGNNFVLPSIHPIYYDWSEDCDYTDNYIPETKEFLEIWQPPAPGCTESSENNHLYILDVRAVGFQIRVPDLEQSIRDLSEGDGDANDAIYSANDDYGAFGGAVDGFDPCAAGASALVPHTFFELDYPKTGAFLAGEIAQTFYYEKGPMIWDQISHDPSVCIPLANSSKSYYSLSDFYSDNTAFFDCLVEQVNSFTPAITNNPTPNFQAVHTPTHLVLSSPESAADIPLGTRISNNSNGCIDYESPTSLHRSQMTTSAVSVRCYPFINPCNQRSIHCLCEDYDHAAWLSRFATDIFEATKQRYLTEYNIDAQYDADLSTFLNGLITNCTLLKNLPLDTEDYDEQVETAIANMESSSIIFSDLVVPAGEPAILDCWDLTPDPCDEGQTIADYYMAEDVEEQIENLVNEFLHDFENTCLNPQQAPDHLQMFYVDREYHFTLYYRTPEGNLYATVPPESVRPLQDEGPALFEQIKNARDNGWSSPVIVPDHRRHSLRDNRMMTIYNYDSYGNLKRTTMPDYEGDGLANDGKTNYGSSIQIYDKVGRLRFAQNPEQAVVDVNGFSRFSYTKYDKLGRIIEVGQLKWNGTLAGLEAAAQFANYPASGQFGLEEITKTYYDEALPTTPGIQTNLRQRVASVAYFETATQVSHTTHYSYDIRGNVETIWKEDANVLGPDSWIKRVDYDFGVVD